MLANSTEMTYTKADISNTGAIKLRLDGQTTQESPPALGKLATCPGVKIEDINVWMGGRREKYGSSERGQLE